MGWDGSGGYTRQRNFSADASAGIKILASAMDQELDDVASAMQLCWARDGQNTPTTDIPMGGNRLVNVGAAQSVSDFIRVREFIENVPIFMIDTNTSADTVSVSAQYFTSVSAGQAPSDGTKIMVRMASDKRQPVLKFSGYSANITWPAGSRVTALVSGATHEFVYNSAASVWETGPQSLIGITAAESSAGVTPTNYEYEPGNILRYGADSTGSADSTTAIQNALNSNRVVYIPTGTYAHTTLTLANYQDIYGDGAKNSILKYTAASSHAINLGTGLVQNIRGIKLYADPGSTGTGIKSDVDAYISDFSIDEYEIEGFNGGIYIPFGLQVTIGKGRLLGPGTAGVNPTWIHTHVAGSVGIQLGDRTQTGALGVQIVNRGNLNGAYPSLYETAVKMHGDIMAIENCTLEFSDVCVECASILNIEGSWLQAETYLFQTYTGGWEIGCYTNKYFDGTFTAQDDLSSMSNLVDSNEELTLFQKSEFRGSGRFRYRFATSATRGIQIGSDSTNDPVLYRSATGIARFQAPGASPLRVNRDASGAVSIFGLEQQGSLVGFIGVDASAQPALLGSGGSNASALWDDAKNLMAGGASIATTATDGFLYVPSCAGTPTGTPTTKTGFVPIVVDTTNHKLYFYSGGSWRDASL